ncbi:MAG: TlpA family protein disulfide reductase [Candidatus Omnitrophica bacterium]|nr:TlpA family protein disulfide reductase [Candidatus Omnitrophota bacterium]
MKKMWILVILTLVLAAYLSFTWISKMYEVPEVVYRPAPDFTLMDIYGNETSLSDFKGKVVILDFWATWCPPCKAEIPHFVELYDMYQDEGLEIIGISLDWNGERVLAPFAKENGMNYPILLGNDDVNSLYGGVMSLPTTFIIDKDGGIRDRFIGYRDKAVFEEAIKDLL